MQIHLRGQALSYFECHANEPLHKILEVLYHRYEKSPSRHDLLTQINNFKAEADENLKMIIERLRLLTKQVFRHLSEEERNIQENCVIRNTIMKFLDPKTLNKVLMREEECFDLCQPFDFIKACIREDSINQETGLAMTASTFLHNMDLAVHDDNDSLNDYLEQQINSAPASPIPTKQLTTGQKILW